MIGLRNVLPFLEWLEHYDFQSLKADLLSGLTVALVLIPQSMAYAQLAGLPPYYGLYASLFPPVIAALFGSSRQLATGPVAVVSLMTAATLEPLATAGSQQFIAYAILLSLMVGIFQFALGILRLGLVVNLISHPVINGFTNAAAIIIATAQLSKIFGVYVDKADHHYETVFRVMKAAYHYTHWPTLFMGLFAFVIMYGLKKLSPKLPNVLLAVAVTTLISWAIGFERNTYVDIDDIFYPKAQARIEEFDRMVTELSKLAEKRNRINSALGKAEKEGDTIAVIEARRDAELIGFELKTAERAVGLCRESLRGMILESATQADASVRYYAKGQLPLGSQSDGHYWRFDVGNKSFEGRTVPLFSGGRVVGTVPRGLPAMGIPVIDPHVALTLLPFCIIIALLGFMEAVSIAKAMAARTGQRIDPNQELIGQGLANICGAFTKSYPNAGSFSRSAVNLQAGAVSGLASLFSSLAVVITLLLLTPFLYHLPQSVLAAIIMVAVIGLLNINGFIHAWKVRWYDGIISIISFVGTLVFAPHLEKGIFLGVALSLMVFVYKSMRPNVVDLSLGLDMALHDCVSYGLQECMYIDVVRFDGPLFFANASYLEDQIRLRRRNNTKLRHIIIDAESINDIDASGEEVLSLTIDRVRSAGIDISLCRVNESVMEVLEKTHLSSKIGEDHIYPTIKASINAVHKQTHKGGEESSCPLTTVCKLDDTV
jgi:MFS superfamily sulfate permease-like transporter